MIRRLLRKLREPPVEPEVTLTAVYEGRTFRYPSKSLVGRYVASGQGWDRVLVPILEGVLPGAEPTIVEVGSNIGASLLQMQLAKPGARFYCFEPSPRFSPVLRANVDENKWSNVVVETLAIGEETGERALWSNRTTASLVAAEYDSHEFVGEATVQMCTLDDYAERNQVRVDFLKSDTDGFELSVLRGARGVLSRDRPALFVEFEPSMLVLTGGSGRELLDELWDAGYRDVLVLSNVGRALGVAGSVDAVLEHAERESYLDLLAVHRDDPAVAELPRLAQRIGSRFSIDAGPPP